MIATGLAVLAVGVAALAMAKIPDAMYLGNGFDIWFQADQPRAVMALSDRMSQWHYRNNVHPLFSLIIFPIVQFIGFFGFSTISACKIFMLLVALSSNYFLYLTLRHLGLSRLQGILGCCVFLSSASFIHWFGLVESFAPSSLTVILCVYLFSSRAKSGAPAVIAASVISISMVITNWTLGLALTFVKFPLGKAIRYSLSAILICLMLSVVQKQIFPKSGYFFSPNTLAYEQKYLSLEDGSKPTVTTVLERVQSFLFSSAVAPKPMVSKDKWSENSIVTNQYFGISNYEFTGIVAVIIWFFAVTIAAISILSKRYVTPIIAGLAIFVSGQAILHSVYGEITFLYIADYFPALLILVCVGGAARWPRVHGICLVFFILFGATANSEAFVSATQMAGRLIDARGS
jgi:hypothetical protein